MGSLRRLSHCVAADKRRRALPAPPATRFAGARRRAWADSPSVPAFMTSLFLRSPVHLVFKWRFGHLGRQRLPIAAALCARCTMPLLSEHHGGLSDRLYAAHAVTAGLMSEIIGEACRRFPSDGAEREDGTDRAIARVRSLDRCCAGADRPRTAALAGPPHRL